MLRLANTRSRRGRMALVRYLSSCQPQSPKMSSRINTLGYESFSTFQPTQAYRRQHQMATVVDYEHREAIRLFLDSLHTAASNFSNNMTAVVAAAMPSKALVVWEESEPQVERHVKSMDGPTLPAEQALSEPEHAKSAAEDTTMDEKHASASNSLNNALKKSTRRRELKKSIRFFNKAVETNHVLSQRVVVDLFYLACAENPIMAYSVLQYYNALPQTTELKVDMYRRLCASVALLDPQYSRHGDIHAFVESLLKELDTTMDMEVKQQLYPRLVYSLASQRNVTVGPYAGLVYKYMVKHEFEMYPGWLKKLLLQSKYNRQEDLPFHDVLARLVEMGPEPHPMCTLPLIHNMFPYTDSEKVCVALEALLALQRGANTTEGSDSLYKDHLLDIATLENISVGAAHSGNSKLVSLVWDVLDQCNYKPTETIYENTIIAFATDDNGLQQAFAAMAAMKADGFEVSRPLVRSFSRAIRSNLYVVYQALEILRESRSSGNDLLSLESLNVVMSSYAERGDVSQAVGILDTIRQYGLKPNVDSYSFAVEVLGKDIHRRKKADNSEWVNRNLDIADSILTMMERDGVAPSADVVRNYVELLCIAKEVSTATSIVTDCLSNDQHHCVNSKTLYRVAVANADAGNFEMAKKLSALTSERIPVLHRKIHSKEQRASHLESVTEAREGDIE